MPNFSLYCFGGQFGGMMMELGYEDEHNLSDLWQQSRFILTTNCYLVWFTEHSNRIRYFNHADIILNVAPSFCHFVTVF